MLKTVGNPSTRYGDQTINNGNLIIGTAGKGVDFSVTSSGTGTMTSELLADYEEGTWVPTDVSGAGLAFTSAAGFYTKVGRVVVATFRIIFPVTADVSSSNFGGLPFTSKNGGAQQQQGSGLRFTNSGLSFSLANPMGAATFQPYTNTGGVITNASFSAKVIDGMIIYQAD